MWNTRDTAVWVRSMPRCAEINYRTRTRQTCDLKPTGFPVPVTIPKNVIVMVFEVKYALGTGKQLDDCVTQVMCKLHCTYA